MGQRPLVMCSAVCSAPQSQHSLVDIPQRSMFAPNLPTPVRSLFSRVQARRDRPTECRDENTCEPRKSDAYYTLTYRRGYSQWPSSLVWTCPDTRRKQRHPQSDGAGNTRYQTTRTSQDDMEQSNQGRHDGRGCYSGCGPRPERVETKDIPTPRR